MPKLPKSSDPYKALRDAGLTEAQVEIVRKRDAGIKLGTETATALNVLRGAPDSLDASTGLVEVLNRLAESAGSSVRFAVVKHDKAKK